MIVISGGIGAGKSVVSRILRIMGYGVFDCDFEAKIIMEKNEKIKLQLNKIGGCDFYDNKGILDRKLLAHRIFQEPKLRKQINSLVHEAVKDRIKDWQKESEKNIFIETAIPCESGISLIAEEIWMVVASPEIRVKRVKQRDGRKCDEIERIMEAQIGEEEMLTVCGKPVYRIINNDSYSLLVQIDSLMNRNN